MRNALSLKVITRYIILQSPLTVALFILLMLSQNTRAISSKVIFVILVVSIAKDILLYPFVWKTYDPGHQKKQNPMIGLTGTAQEGFEQEGYIMVRGELWRAQVVRRNLTIEKDEKVLVCGADGLTLLIIPIDD